MGAWRKDVDCRGHQRATLHGCIPCLVLIVSLSFPIPSCAVSVQQPTTALPRLFNLWLASEVYGDRGGEKVP